MGTADVEFSATIALGKKGREVDCHGQDLSTVTL
jgi:hypothetical protein